MLRTPNPCRLLTPALVGLLAAAAPAAAQAREPAELQAMLEQVVAAHAITKLFTAAAALRLAEEGRLSLAAPIETLIAPETRSLLSGGGYDPAAIRVRDLLGHTSGLYDYAEDAAFQASVLADPRKRWTRREQIAFAMRHGRPYGRPGEIGRYSDTGYLILGEIIERASGLPLADAYRRLLRFDQLGLGATWLESLEAAPPGAAPKARQYLGDADVTGLDPSFDLYGGGGLVSTVDDLARFGRALFRGEVFARPETLATALAISTVPRAPGHGERALIAFAMPVAGHRCWGHGGFWGGALVHCPEVDLTIAVSLNAGESDTAVRDLVQALGAAALARTGRAGATDPGDDVGLARPMAQVRASAVRWPAGTDMDLPFAASSQASGRRTSVRI